MTTRPPATWRARRATGSRWRSFPTTEEAARACRQHGIAVMMGAPNLIRGGSHSGQCLGHDLAEADLLDIVSSDYVPSALLYSAIAAGGDVEGLAARHGHGQRRTGPCGGADGSRATGRGDARRSGPVPRRRRRAGPARRLVGGDRVA
jgi:alpha-D-ribose 1-methylphosphonate 5-triphosphate diphosphatase